MGAEEQQQQQEAPPVSKSMFDTSDLLILAVIGILTAMYFYTRSQGKKSAVPIPSSSSTAQKTDTKTAVSSKSKKKSLIKALEERGDDQQVVFFYGSQTGTGEDLANRMAKEITANLEIQSLVCDPEEYDMSEMEKWPADKKWLVGFFLATYGEGEPTDNAVEFFEWIMGGKVQVADVLAKLDEPDDDEDTSGQPLANVSFIMFGLGNKTYEHFNGMARLVDKRFLRWGGATRIGERGEGDDDGSLEEDFLKWKPDTISKISEYFGMDPATAGVPSLEKPHVPLFTLVSADAKKFGGELTNSLVPRKWTVSEQAELGSKGGRFGKLVAKFVEQGKASTFDAKHPYYSPVTEAHTLFRDCLDSYSFAEAEQKHLDFSEIRPAKSYIRHWTANEPKANGKTRGSKANGHVNGAVTSAEFKIERQCLHIELDIPKSSGIKYETGDHVGIWPENDPEEVVRMGARMGLSEADLDKAIDLKGKDDKSKPPFPTPCSWRTALTFYCDLRDPLKQYHLEILAKYAKDEGEKQFLWKLATERDQYNEWIESGQKSAREVLDEFTSVDLPPAVILTEILGRIGIRYYSISSSSKVEPHSVGITAVITRYAINQKIMTSGGQLKNEKVLIKTGLATGWLERVQQDVTDHEANPEALGVLSGEHVEYQVPKFHLPMYIRTSAFRLPKNPKVPVIMIGPGTGVAPFRGFVRDRVYDAEQGNEVGSTVLFFGCRKSDEDFLYRDEWEEISRKVESWRAAEDAAGGPIPGQPRSFDWDLVTAFSREGAKKVYVQHRIAEHGEKVWKLLNDMGGNLYVCGEAKHMAKDVEHAIINLAVKFGDRANEEAGREWFKDMKHHGRYMEDVW